MQYFKTYSSNTVAGGGSQYFFKTDDPNKTYASRTFYKVTASGEYGYSFLFTNIIDSTFEDGSKSHCNLVLDEWYIEGVRVGISDFCDENGFTEPSAMKAVTFDGMPRKTVLPGEFFTTDEITLSANAGEYICLEIAFSGEYIPNHEESIISSFVLSDDGKWISTPRHPFPSMVGCNRPVKARVGFLGDSITQGIGSDFNSYGHWNAVLAEKLGNEYSYWNLGLGYARGHDAATDGAWLFKAKQCDIVFLCLGVNDLGRGYSADDIINSLTVITEKLLKAGCKVIIQTVPPFDYSGDKITKWETVNAFIKSSLKDKVELVFDCVEVLKKSDEEPYLTVYGDHPNNTGCRLWGEALYESISHLDLFK